MPVSDKAKNTGKFIVLMLCFAIIFFLLLPFLEDPAAVAAAQSKKATPQIFTSNPLTELARKIYSLFGPRYRKAGGMAAAQGRYANAYAQNDWPDGYTEEFLTADTRYSAAHAEEETANGSNGGSTVYFPEAYDFGEAGFVNEAGEWVLIRQTAPEAAQRGMHDINSSDTAYDRFVRLERSAKYAVPNANAAEQIPSSKWARLFKPINKLLGLGETEIPAAVSSPAGLRLASADGMDNGGPRRPTERFAHRPSLDMPQGSGASSAAAQAPAAPDGWSLLDILNPARSFERLHDMVNDWYSPQEPAQQLSPTDKERREAALQLIRQQQVQTRQQTLAQISQDAQGQQAASLAETFSSCRYGSSVSYQGNTAPVSSFLAGIESSGEEADSCPLVDPAQQAKDAAEQGKKSIEQLTEVLGFTPPPLNVVIVMGKEQPRFEITQEEYNNKPEETLVKEFYNYLSGTCPDGNCYWVAATDEAADLATAMGGSIYSDPLGVMPERMSAFTESKLQQAREEGMDEEAIQQLQSSLEFITPAYVAYNTQQWRALQAPPRAQGAEQVKPHLILTPTAANANTFAADTRIPATIFYDTTGQVLNGNSTATPAQQGAIIADQVAQRAQKIKEDMNRLEQELARMRLDGVLGDRMQQAQQELEQKKKEWEEQVQSFSQQ